MSTIFFSTIQNTYVSTSNVLGSGGGGGGSSFGSGSPYRNVLYNGGFIVDQKLEGTQLLMTTNAIFDGPDRYFFNVNTTNARTYSMQRSNVGDNITSQSFALNVSTHSNTTLDTNDTVGVIHRIEAQQIDPFRWGQSGASSAALSFWIRSSVTGNHCVSIQNATQTHSYVIPVSVSVANLWQRITATISAPPNNSVWTGTTTLNFNLYGDSLKTSSTSTWLTGNFICTSTFPSALYSTGGNYFQITAVQLEMGANVSLFEGRGYKDEVKFCQRYYEKSFSDGTVPSNNTAGTDPGVSIALSSNNSMDMIRFKIHKSSIPTISLFNPNSSTGVVSTDTITSSNLTAFQLSIGGFGVTTTDTNLFNQQIYFNWTANVNEITVIPSVVYPPVGISNIVRFSGSLDSSTPFSETGTVSGQSYGNGTYIMTLSSGYGGDFIQGPASLVDYNSNTFMHTNWSQLYDAQTFLYNGTTTTSVTSVGNVLGEYFQYQLPTAIKADRITFNHTDNARMPNQFTVVVSNNGTTWIQIYDKTDMTWTTNVGDYSWTKPTTAYLYYRVIVKSLRGSGAVLNMTEALLYGSV